MYCFRIRLRLDPRNRIGTDVEELVFADDTGGSGRVALQAHGQHPIPLSEAAQLVLRGEGYASEVEAEKAAARWVLRLRLVFAGSLIGADFGLRGPTQHITPHGLAWLDGLLPTRNGRTAVCLGRLSGFARRPLEKAAAASARAENRLLGGRHPQGTRVLQDVHGTQIYECEPRPAFAEFSLGLIAKRSPERFRAYVAEATEKGVALHEKEQLAFEVFSGSFFEPTVDGRLLTLMIAVEVLTVAGQRDEATTAHIDELIASTQSAALTPEQTEPLVNALRGLKQESINRAGQRLAQTLGSRTYLEQSPLDFFRRCYRVRSQLVHGGHPYPTFDVVNTLGGALELFVRDLLLLAAGLSPSE
jgi:hypothetical protein